MKTKLRKEINKRSQAEHIDEIFALLVFLVFIFLGLLFIDHFYRNRVNLTIDQKFIDTFYNYFRTEIEKRYYFIHAPADLGYDILTFTLENKTFDLNEPYVIENRTLYVLKRVRDKEIIEITYFEGEFENRSNLIEVEFSCTYDVCRIPKEGILYGFERNLPNYVKFYEVLIVKSITYKQDRGFLIISNNFSKNHRLFQEFYAENPIIRIKSSIKNLNSKLFIDFYLLQPIPYSDIELTLDLFKFYYVTTSRYLKYFINYQRAKDLNQTICINDETKYIVFAFEFMNKEYNFIIASPSLMNVTLCYDEENLSLSIRKRIKNFERITLNVKDALYDFNLDTYNYNVTEGVPIKKRALSQRKIDQYFKLKPDLGIDLQFRDIIITDENGKYLYTFGKETLSNVKVETFVEKMILDLEDFKVVPIYISFLEWKE